MTSPFNKAPSSGQSDPQQLEAELVSQLVSATYEDTEDTSDANEITSREGRAERFIKIEMIKYPGLLQRFESNRDLVVYEMKEKFKGWNKGKKMPEEDEDSAEKFQEAIM